MCQLALAYNVIVMNPMGTTNVCTEFMINHLIAVKMRQSDTKVVDRSTKTATLQLKKIYN